MKIWIKKEKRFYPVTFEQAKKVLTSGLSWKQWTSDMIERCLTIQND